MTDSQTETPSLQGRYPTEPGEWKLISPSGKIFLGKDPVDCVIVEGNHRIPEEARAQKLLDLLEDDEEHGDLWTDLQRSLGKFYKVNSVDGLIKAQQKHIDSLKSIRL